MLYNKKSKGFAFLHPLSPSARSLHPPPAAVAHQARAGFAVASDLSISANEKSTAKRKLS